MLIHAAITTDRVLRKVRYHISRFRQMAFHLWTSQLSLGLGVALLFVLLRLNHVIETSLLRHAAGE